MPEVNISGPAGRIEARYHHERGPNAPVALILHPHPQFGGTMNNQVVYHLYYAFQKRGFSVLRFNFRGVGRSEGLFDNGPGEAQTCWIAGVSFGAWIAMQLLMRRPEIEGFVSVAPPANLYDFTFLAPCPSSGLMVNGAKDRVVPTESVRGLVDRLKTQKGIVIDHSTVPDANHFFEGRMDGLMEVVNAYLDKRLGKGKKRKESAA
jgi:alpha/beta superfamily hydrolase